VSATPPIVSVEVQGVAKTVAEAVAFTAAPLTEKSDPDKNVYPPTVTVVGPMNVLLATVIVPEPRTGVFATV